MRVGDVILNKEDEKGVIAYIDKTPDFSTYLCVFKEEDSSSSAAWYSLRELRLVPKFSLGETVKDGIGTKYTIVSICEGNVRYPILAVRNINKNNAHCESFTIEGHIYADVSGDDSRNLIPN
jgi:hypothetical protein